MRARVARVALAALVLASGFGPGCATKLPPGELMLVVDSDLSLPKDIDALEVAVLVRGDVRFKQLFETLGDVASLKLPASLGVVIGEGVDPSTEVTFRVTAFRAGVPKVLREAVTTVPATRLAALRLPVQWLCWDQVVLDDLGKPVSTCPAGQTCVAGGCADKTVDATSLPDYDAASTFGGGTGNGDGACFDVGACFLGSLDATLDLEACTLTSPAEVNLAIRVDTAGICGPAGCFVPLDAESDVGWRSSKEGVITLPSSVCQRIKDGKASGVAVAATSDTCAKKTEGLPVCGAWSSTGKAPPTPGSVAPVVLAGNQSHPTALALAGAFVYWANSGSEGVANGAVKRMPTIGGSTAIQLGTLAFPRDLALDFGGKAAVKSVYFTTAGVAGKGGGVSGIDLATSPPKAIPLLFPGLSTPEGVLVSEGSLFFTDLDGGAIYAFDLTTKMAQVVASPSNGTGQNRPYRLAADAATLFWVNEGTAMSAGSVMLADRLDPTPVVIADMQSTPRAITLDVTAGVASTVYWANAGSGEVMKAPLSGTPTMAGAAVAVATMQAAPSGLALDETSLYWTNHGDGTVMRAPRAGGAPVAIAKGQVAPGAIAVDASYVYWVNEGSPAKADGALVKISKTAPLP